MKAEIIAVGSELLLGQITNTNATFISSRLAEVGIDVHYHTVVGDNPERLNQVIRLARQRSSLLIFTGGLGPTKDDLTKETIAKQLDVELVSDEEALHSIEQYFTRSGRTMTANNKKQALVFKGASVLPNRHGMAPGMALSKEGIQYILLPGPPHEMQPMFEKEAIPYILGVNGQQYIIASRVLKFYGIGEAELEFRIEDLLEQQTNPTIAPLASPDAVTLRLTAKAATTEAAEQLMDDVECQLRERVGEYLFGTNADSLPSKAAEMLKQHGWTIAAAESLTAGLFLAELAGEPGISSSLEGGLVVYNEKTKIEQLGISPSLLDTFGIVSSQCAAALAESVRKKFSSSIGVGLTGAAGPDPHDGKPMGTVWIGIASEWGKTETYLLKLSASRNANRLRAARFALFYLIQYMNNHHGEN